MSLPVTGWGESVRTSAFLVLRMSWTTVSVAMADDVIMAEGSRSVLMEKKW
jgi:hypothetical protein